MRFYTVEWIKEIWYAYLQKGEDEIYFIEKKGVGFDPKPFFLALIHIYSRKEIPSFLKILEVEEVELIELKSRQGFDFMYLVDLLRKEFAVWFRDLILHKDFKAQSLVLISCEFLMLEEQLRKQIQIPLLDKLKKLTMNLEEIEETKKGLESFNERQFIRLFGFFNTVENLERSLSYELVERAKTIAKKVYGENFEERFEIGVETQPEVRKEFKVHVKDKLKELLKGSHEWI